MQGQTQTQVGDTYHFIGFPDIKVRVNSIDHNAGRISYECLWLIPPNIEHETLKYFGKHFVRSLNKHPGMLSPAMAISTPSIGDKYLDASGATYEIIDVDSSTGDVRMRSAATTNLGNKVYGPVFHVSANSLGRLFHAAASFPPGGGSQAAQRQGLNAWLPDPPNLLLPPGQSNEFFEVEMKGITNKCTCGIDSVGGGKHSDWCDKHETEEKT